MSITTSLVLVDETTQTRAAIAGFLAGYCGATRRSYATDLRIFAAWCAGANLELFAVRRAHLELFSRWMEENNRMRSTVARRLSTLASFYRYCEQEGLISRNPAANVRRPKVDYESRTLGLDRNELGAFLVQAGLGSPATMPWRRCWPSTACVYPRRSGPTSTTWSSSGGTAPSRSCARAASTP